MSAPAAHKPTPELECFQRSTEYRTAMNPKKPEMLDFTDWTGRRDVPTIGTNSGASVLPFQSWRPFKESFAPELIETAVSETPGSVTHIVDPFGGSGTTALAAQFLGMNSTTIEVNPFLADLIEAKIGTINLDQATSELHIVTEDAARCPRPDTLVFPGAPSTFVEPGKKGRWIFSRDVAARILAYRSAIEKVVDLQIQRLFKVILASVAIPVSNVTISGKGRRYRSNWQNRPATPDRVDRLFQEGVKRAFNDLRQYGARRCQDYLLLRGDARDLASTVEAHDVAVFSPPYPNSSDYTDVYNVELWTLGYLDGRKANTSLRKTTLRSHIQIIRDLTYGDLKSPLLARTITELHSVRSHLWNKHIPEMIGAYMADLTEVLQGLATGLRTRGRIYMVVGNSCYADIEVNVAEILAEIVPQLGYQVVRLTPCRSIRMSPQQGGRPKLAETLVVLKRN